MHAGSEMDMYMYAGSEMYSGSEREMRKQSSNFGQTYYIHICTNTHGKSIDSFLPSSARG